MISGLAFYIFSSVLLLACLGVILSRNPVHGVLFLIVSFFNAAALFVLLGAEFLAMLLVIVYVGAVAVLFLFVVMMLDIRPTPKKSTRNVWKELYESFFGLAYYMAIFIPLSLGAYWALSWGAEHIGLGDLMQNGLPLIAAFFIDHTPPSALSLFMSCLVLFACALFAAPTARRWSGVSGLEAFVELVEILPLSWMVGILLLGEFLYFAGTWKSSSFAAQSVNAPLPPTDLLGNTQALASLLYRYYAYVFQACGLILLVAMIGAIVLSLRKKTTLRRQNILEQVTRSPKDCVDLVHIPLNAGVSDV